MCLYLTGSSGNRFLGVIGPGANLLELALHYASLHVLGTWYSWKRNCIFLWPEHLQVVMDGRGGRHHHLDVSHHASALYHCNRPRHANVTSRDPVQV